eukprot:895796_1
MFWRTVSLATAIALCAMTTSEGKPDQRCVEMFNDLRSGQVIESDANAFTKKWCHKFLQNEKDLTETFGKIMLQKEDENKRAFEKATHQIRDLKQTPQQKAQHKHDRVKVTLDEMDIDAQRKSDLTKKILHQMTEDEEVKEKLSRHINAELSATKTEEKQSHHHSLADEHLWLIEDDASQLPRGNIFPSGRKGKKSKDEKKKKDKKKKDKKKQGFIQQMLSDQFHSSYYY